MSPLANAMGFIDDKPAQKLTSVKILQRVEKLAACAQFFRGYIQQFCLGYGSGQIVVDIVDNAYGGFSRQLKRRNLEANTKLHVIYFTQKIMYIICG